MNYKKLIPNREIRLKILRLLSFVPDKYMIKTQYYLKTGRRLNLKNPRRFTEKLQWYKLYYKNPEMIRCVDKYEVRKYVEEKGLKSILIPCYGVFDRVEDIDWKSLPDQFVMKDTLGGGGTSVVIVKNKNDANIELLNSYATKWISLGRTKDSGREWPYHSGKKHRIIIEKYMDADLNGGGLVDYKFFCFDGVPLWLYVIADRVMGEGGCLGVYDTNFVKMNVLRKDEHPLRREVKKPDTFERMIKIASILSKGFPEARVDLYDYRNEVLFGEITFFDGSGYMTFDPDEYDYVFGNAFSLESAKLYDGLQ